MNNSARITQRNESGRAARPRGESALLNIVVPCFNEQEVLPQTAGGLAELLDTMIAGRLIAPSSGVYFVDDGSRDRTWDIIADLAAANPGRFHGIRLSRNRGHQNAVLAGLLNTPGDMLVSIDADLQDAPEAIAEMVTHYHEGCEIVLGVRAARPSDTAFKRITARLYYAVLHRLGVEIVPDHADFRLLSRRAVDALARYSEVNLFLRGIVPLLGFRTGIVYYTRRPRLAGETKYPLGRMLALSIDGITSFSMRPLRFITALGILVSFVSFLIGAWAIGLRLFGTSALPGWTSIVVPIALIGGLQLLSLGVIGEYIGKIYLEVKRRPPFEIADEV